MGFRLALFPYLRTECARAEAWQGAASGMASRTASGKASGMASRTASGAASDLPPVPGWVAETAAQVRFRPRWEARAAGGGNNGAGRPGSDLPSVHVHAKSDLARLLRMASARR